ncbi:MAG: HtaA domain-containing protein [Solirubrobacteraceae bacterium]|nr:HtaA domain-containing protein [Solirubrobacteraceae bacterium]
MAAVLAVTVPAAAGTAGASAAAVASGSLSWTHFNHRTGTGQPAISNCPAGLNCTRTFLGYTTGIGANPPPPGASNGAAPSAPASGPVVTPASAFSANVAGPAAYTWVFPTPATGAGTFDPATRSADAEFRGTLTFYAHGTTFFTLTNPRIVLNGGTPDGTDGQLFASGQNTGEMGGTDPPPSYDRSAHVHDLDLRGATTTTNADGSMTIAGIVPNLNLAAFAGLAGFGQGSDRAPNAQGSFAVTLSSTATAPPVGGGTGGGSAGAPSAGGSGSGGNASIGGNAAIALQGVALRGLRSRGVRVAGSGGARVSVRSLGLPVSRGTVAGWASLRHSGDLTLRAGRRSVRLRAFRTTLRSRSVFISAAIGKRRVTVFASRPRPGAVRAVAAAESIGLRTTPVTLTAAGARAIRRALGLRSLAGGKLGMLTISARPGGGAATTSPLARPAGAVDLASARITWNVRESFVRYIGTGEGTSVGAGATADPPVVIPPTDVPLSYAFHYPFASGWRDASSSRALVRGTGAVTFGFAERGIRIIAADPEVVLDGRRSRASFVLRGSAGDRLTGRRVVLMNLDPAKAAATTTSPDGRTITYDRIPATIPQGTQTSVFAGFYVPGEAFGSISISLTRR